MFTREFLLGLRRKALRRRVWYGCLDGVDRGIFYLVTRVVDRIESDVLGVVVLRMVRRLRDALKSEFARVMESDGLRMARDAAERAVEWGSGVAGEWARDPGYVRYLTVLTLNRPPGWGL
jgi:hypothetical protein